MTAQGAIAPDGNYNIEFKLYNASSSSGSSQGSCTGDTACLWVETRTGGNTVRVVNGYLTVQLGSVTPFPANMNWHQNLWLTMNVGGTGTTPAWDGEMSPRLALTAVPYALDSGALNGLSASAFGQLAGTQTWTGPNTFQPATNTTSAFNVQTSTGSNLLTVDSVNDRVGVNLGGSATPASTLEVNGTLRLSGTSTENYTTPMGSHVPTKINIPLLDPGSYGQIVAFGLPASAQTTARALSLFDGRTAPHQPTLEVFSPNENEAYGLSWNGTNTTPLLTTTTNNLALQVNGLNALTVTNSSGIAAVGVGVTTPNYPIDVAGVVNSSTGFDVAGTPVCTSAGCVPQAGSTNYIQNTTTAQNANIAVSNNGATSATTVLIRQSSGQTGKLLQLQNSASNPIGSIDANGNLAVNGAIEVGSQTSPTADISLAAGSNRTLAVQAASSGNGNNLSVQAGDGASTGNTNGGNLYLQGGAAAGTGQGGSVIVQPKANSTAAFEVQNAAGTPMLSIDTASGYVLIGSGSTGHTNPTLLVVDSGTQATDPQEVNGAIYYNTATHTFRCGQNGVWVTCEPFVYSQNDQGNRTGNLPPATDTVANTTTATTFGDTYTMPANDCEPGHIYRLTGGGVISYNTSNPTIKLSVMWGSTPVAVSDPNASLYTGGGVNNTNVPWFMTATLTCYTNYAGTMSMEAVGQLTISNDANGPAFFIQLGDSSVGQTVTTSSAQTLGVRWQWGAASSADSITLRSLIIEELGP